MGSTACPLQRDKPVQVRFELIQRILFSRLYRLPALSAVEGTSQVSQLWRAFVCEVTLDGEVSRRKCIQVVDHPPNGYTKDTAGSRVGPS